MAIPSVELPAADTSHTLDFAVLSRLGLDGCTRLEALQKQVLAEHIKTRDNLASMTLRTYEELTRIERDDNEFQVATLFTEELLGRGNDCNAMVMLW